MISIFYHRFSHFSAEKWAYYFQQMPPDVRERINRYHRTENKYQLLIGRLLLKKGMDELGFKDFQLHQVFYNEQGCPLSNEPIKFNIAHSGNVVACAFGESALGLDIERVRPISLVDFDYILNELDQIHIAHSSKPFVTFFKIWTIKEAVTKALGQGLAIDVQQIFIHENYADFANEKWYFRPLALATDYAGHLVVNRPDWTLDIQEIKF